MADAPSNHEMLSGTATWTYDLGIGAMYVSLDGRSAPPYLKNKRVEAILDLDAAGNVAGIEILSVARPSDADDPIVRRAAFRVVKPNFNEMPAK